jgi:hypothetical protein
MNDTAVLERLVPAGDVLELLAGEYDRRNDYANFDVCKLAALDTLLARLRDGYLKAWSTACNIDSTLDTGPTSIDQLIATWDFHRHDGSPAEVPREFWMHFHYAGGDRRAFDPVAGDFRFTYTDGEYSQREGSAYGVFFDPRGLPAVAVPSWHGPVENTFQRQVAPTVGTQSGKGRPPATWWPAFAEELAFYIHEHGRPETQEALIAAVFDALARQGKPEPSRTQVQPVVRQLLDRLGKAGK